MFLDRDNFPYSPHCFTMSVTLIVVFDMQAFRFYWSERIEYQIHGYDSLD
jgi:hypothetical protein